MNGVAALHLALVGVALLYASTFPGDELPKKVRFSLRVAGVIHVLPGMFILWTTALLS